MTLAPAGDLSIDLEIFLNGLAENGHLDDILSSSVSSDIAPYFTADLYQAMGGVIMAPGMGGVGVNISASTAGNDIIITANSADGLASMADITLTKPLGSTWAWTDVIGFSTIWYEYNTTYNFEILATVMISGNPVEVVLEGNTDIQIGNCNYETPCEREDNLGDEFYNIFNFMFTNSLLSTNTSNNILASGVTNGWYEGSETQLQLGDFGSTATFTNNSAGYFTITNGTHEIEVNFGAYPTNVLYLSGATFDGSLTTGTLTIYYVSTSGVESTLTATVTFEVSTVATLFELSCPDCDQQEALENAMEDLLNYLLTLQANNQLGMNGFGDFAQLNTLEPYLTVNDPGIHYVYTTPQNAVTDQTHFGFRFDKTDCPLIFQQVGSSANLNLLVEVYDVQITPSVSGYDITCKGVIDNGSTLLVVNLASYGFTCLNFEGCNNCTPDALRPVSCNDMWYDYNLAITALNASITTLYDDFPTYTEDEFCAGNYAYVTEAYLQYISLLGITDNNHPRYLSISQFANTDIGYGYLNQSNGTDLTDLVTDFDAYLDANPTSTMTWHEYITLQMPDIPICPKQLPLPMDITIQYPCEQLTANIDTVNAQNQYEIYLNNVMASFKEKYIEEAMATVIENFDMQYNDKEYHYTLYYYDQAGNLIQTVPPQGIDRIEQSEIDQTTIDNTRLSTSMSTPTGLSILPVHTMVTNYNYNSLNQLTKQQTPDGGESNFGYDKLGRLVVSQNAKQKLNSGGEQFSYTRYDAIGRIVEVGEMTLSGNYDFNENGKFVDPSGNLVVVEADNFPQNLGAALLGREEVTFTFYDELISSANSYFGSYEKYHTRNRITGVVYLDIVTDTSQIELYYTNATFYEYDVHGNVQEVVQVNHDEDLVALGQFVKKTKYEYDLVSGNVKEVAYQNDKQDQFVHRYEYDADNRITNVYTSKDREYWEQDAKYFYYEHGPLARTEIGQQKVQASDFAYTVQGWLKGVNSQDLQSDHDQGKDSKSGTINSMNAQDVYGYSLHYFDGATAVENDYTARFGTADFLAYSTGTAAYSSPYNLYNGNIKEMYTANTNTDEEYIGTNHTWYRYDQLNRIKSMNDEIIDGTTVTANQYASTYSYDKNGNLQTLSRYAPSGIIDDMTYHYVSPTMNQLAYVDDSYDAAGMDDFVDQNAGNYTYTPIGELYSDASEEIESIDWKVTGKVKRIYRANTSTQPEVEFVYDAMGNRIAKFEYTSTGDIIDKTYYFLDAQGNVMSIYTLKLDGTTKNLYLSERNIYGSSRVGIENVNQIIASTAIANVNINSENTTNMVIQKVGDKSYELSNHLGNVLEVVTDRKLAIETAPSSGIIAYYSSDVTSFSDYFPFGWTLPTRNGSASDYRYSFNGKEKIDEVAGSGNSIDFGARIYDSRVGRWLSGDPLKINYPSVSPYCFVLNSPLIFTDPDGKRVKPLSPAALECIRLTLSPEEAEYVKLNRRGFIDKSTLKKGVKELGLENIGTNFSSLITLVKSNRIVDVSIATSVETSNNGVIEFPTTVVNDYEEYWKYVYRGSEDFTGTVTVDGVVMNFEEFQTYYDENNLGPGIYVPGVQGITCIPNKYVKTEFDKNLLLNGNQYGKRGHTQVVINAAVLGNSELNAVQVLAHELFGHALMSILKKSAFHGTHRNTDNPELEAKINEAVTEATINYEKHQEKK